MAARSSYCDRDSRFNRMASKSITESQYFCTLTPSAANKAYTELGETPETRLVEVKELRKRIETIPGLKPNTDIRFLLGFLRCRKFDQERAFQMLRNYYLTKRERSDFFDDLKPSRMRHVIHDKIIEVLENRNNDGCRVVIMRLGSWDPSRYGLMDIPKLLFLVLSKLSEDEDTQVHGLHIINNLRHVTWKQGKHVGPGLAKFFMGVLQDMVPLRLKRLDYLYEPTFFDIIFPIVKQFMKDKVVRRIHLNGENVRNLYTIINPDFLPEDMGGKQKTHGYSNIFMKELVNNNHLFEEDNKFGFVGMRLEDVKKERKKEDAELLLPIPGSVTNHYQPVPVAATTVTIKSKKGSKRRRRRLSFLTCVCTFTMVILCSTFVFLCGLYFANYLFHSWMSQFSVIRWINYI